MASNKLSKRDLKKVKACMDKLKDMETRKRPTWNENKKIFKELDEITSGRKEQWQNEK